VIWRGERFLAVSRPEGKIMAGYLEFPGGKIEPGEDCETALARELDEELGVAPREVRFWREVRHVYDHGAIRLFFYHVLAMSGEPAPREAQALAWLTPSEADPERFLPADRDILFRLATEIPRGNTYTKE
jgi:8-oxo-dGTP diphosphatase